MAPAARPAQLLAPAAVGAPLPFAAPLPIAPPFVVPTFGPATAAGPLFFPPLLFPGGGGGGDVTNIFNNPPAAGPSPVPGVPEPASWIMMIIGFGLTGGVLRRRRRLTKASTRSIQPLAPGFLPMARSGAL
jgi:hypothetical protein